MRSAIVATALLVLAGCASAQKTAPPARPPVPVTTGVAVRRDVPLVLRTVGTTSPSESVTVKPQISAVLAKVRFAEGDTVEAGAPLYQLDDRDLVAAAAQAEAVLARDRAQAAFAAAEAVRAEDLERKGLTSTQQADQARSARDAAKAAVTADEAALTKVRLDLSRCTVTAPIAGRTGRSPVTAGNLVTAGQTTLVTISRMQPMALDFALPGTEIATIRAASATGPLQVAVVAEGASQPEAGTLALIDVAVDPSTGTVPLRASLANAADRLWPGQQCRVELRLGDEKDVVTVPEKAVQTGQKGSFVWTIGDDGTASPRQVGVSRILDGTAVIASGLKGGETVVIDGHIRLVPGAAVSDANAKAEPKAGPKAERAGTKAP